MWEGVPTYLLKLKEEEQKKIINYESEINKDS